MEDLGTQTSFKRNMKIAVISDIHANLEALEAVLADIESQQLDRIICLGDLVGYGPDPDEVVNRVRELGIDCVLGNHEAALSSKKALGWLNFLARENNLATKALLSEKSLAWCASLEKSVSYENASFVHGCPPDSILRYLYKLSDEEVVDLASKLPEQLFFVGHTHELRLISVDRGMVVRDKLKEGRTRLDDDKKYLINVGSVGHPRDGNSRAKYVIWDSGTGLLDVRGIEYPAHLTADKIIARGFPKAYALCLSPRRATG